MENSQNNLVASEAECLNGNCWLVKNLNYPPYKRCRHCRSRFRNCLFLHYQIVSVILIAFALGLLLFVEGKISMVATITIFTLVIVYGYFFNTSTEKIVEANFNQAKAKEALEELTGSLKQRVNAQTKDLRQNKKELEIKNQTLEDQATHLKKLLVMRSEFLDIASHQLKTPVSVIMGTAVMFKEGSMAKLTKEQQTKFVDNILQKSKKLRLIINDILRASEMDTDNFKLGNIKKPFSLVELLDKLYKEFKIDAGERKLNVVWKKPDKDATMVGDEDLFGQAISNLLDNAIKYTKEGDITLSLQLAGKRAIIEVSDHGIGIPQNDQKKIFDKFGRAKNAVNMYTDGSGLGLFIVKKIIEAHGGKISFKSQENKGTTFTAELPLITVKPA